MSNTDENGLAGLFEPPYYAVIFTNVRTDEDDAGYGQTAEEMLVLAAEQPGYLGVESVRESKLGISVSYWRDLESIKKWKAVGDHITAQRSGHGKWYRAYNLRISKVESERSWTAK